jgi:hypothetical protein
MNVDLPQPDGPINAVILLSGISRLIFLRACFCPYHRFKFFEMIFEINVDPLFAILVDSLIVELCHLTASRIKQEPLLGE